MNKILALLSTIVITGTTIPSVSAPNPNVLDKIEEEIRKLEKEQKDINLLKPTGYVMHQQFNIQQLYVLPTLYLCVLYSSENKQRLVSLTA